MIPQPEVRFDEAEYLEWERSQEERHEYLDGEIVAMGGASARHSLIVTNLAGELRFRLRDRPCQVHSNDLRVRVSETGLYTYPDVLVVCGEPTFTDDRFDTLLDPWVIFEVLSASTEAIDRGRKFEHYRRLSSLRDYLLVAQDRRHVEHYTRQPDGRWSLGDVEGDGGVIALGSLDCELPLSEVYEKVQLGATQGRESPGG